MRDANTAISCKFRFSCPDPQCEPCRLKLQKSSNSKTSKPVCPTESREFIFFDSYLHFNASLSKCIDDIRNVAYQTNTPLSTQFPSTYRFATIHCNYTHSQFLEIVKGKLVFPFNLAQSIPELANIKSVPPKEAFTDKLSDNSEISQDDYSHFSNLWSVLRFDSLLHCLWTYNLLDAGMWRKFCYSIQFLNLIKS